MDSRRDQGYRRRSVDCGIGTGYKKSLMEVFIPSGPSNLTD
ncbi:hypothetical protein CLOSCI_01275 [[Clostridium] scindens ATCC 35704]|nr:hypothetical protein [[Clostridium] scindens]EDS07466.1 hypothetical protein CLOSCI_01275 [[Clostridium] scindens ATCC 35704]